LNYKFDILPDACGIDIFHGDFGFVDSDICGDG